MRWLGWQILFTAGDERVKPGRRWKNYAELALRTGLPWATKTWHGTWSAADAWTQGLASAEAAVKFLSGEKVEKTIYVPEFKVNAKNVEEFAETCGK